MNLPLAPQEPSPLRRTLTPFVLAIGIIIEIAIARALILQHQGGSAGAGHAIFFGIAQLPYILTLILLLLSRKLSAVGLAAGIATAICGVALLFEIILACFGAFFFSWVAKDDPAPFSLLLWLILTNAFILFIGLSARRWAPGVFSRALLGTIGYCMLGALALQSIARIEWKDSLKAEGTTNTTAHGLFALTSCLIQFKFHNPESGYPATLESISSGCCAKLANKDVLNGYAVQYIPLHSDPAKTTFTGFKLLATPRGRKRPGLEPLLSDDSGNFFQLYGWSQPGQQPQIRPIFVDTPLRSLGGAIKDFAKQHPDHPVPLNFDDLVGPASPLQNHGPTGSLGTKFQSGYFSIEYFPPITGHSHEYSLTATCTYYGSDCLRSYRLDSSDNMHVTGEPRPATVSDPVVSRDCLMLAKCNGLVWPAP
jgi:hypothetical protein